MCGRFTLPLTPEQVRRLLELDQDLTPEQAALTGRYNIAPGQPVLAAVQPGPDAPRKAVALRWGLVPPWSDDPAIGHRLINARSETVDRKPTFRDAFHRRRCLVPAGGFYEWERGGGRRRPWYFRPRRGEGLVLAGLWEEWRPRGKPGEPPAPPLYTCTLLTTEANPLVARVHPRMPVVLPPEAFHAWLTAPPERAADLRAWLHPCPPDRLEAYPVSRRVNDPRHEGADCVRPAQDPGDTGAAPATLF